MWAAHGTFDHVKDSKYFELPFHIKLHLPHIGDHYLTKFMVLQVLAALIVFFIFKGLSRRIADGSPARGRFWNFWEALALFVRDELVRPTIGEGHHGHGDDHDHDHDSHQHHGSSSVDASHPADKYLPFVWSCFFYVLICNLLGAIPWMGSATGNLNVTGVLALSVFGMVVLAGSKELGGAEFWMALVPSMDVPGVMKPIIIPMIWLIELLGLFIKHGVLAVRLFANIMAGHTVIAVVLGFIAMAAHAEMAWVYYVVTPASVLGQVAIGMLELFVAFLQAYVFAFLATLFIGTAVHPH